MNENAGSLLEHKRMQTNGKDWRPLCARCREFQDWARWLI